MRLTSETIGSSHMALFSHQFLWSAYDWHIEPLRIGMHVHTGLELLVPRVQYYSGSRIEPLLRQRRTKAGSALVRTRCEQAPCLNKSHFAVPRCGRRSLLSRMRANAYKRQSVLSEHPLRTPVGHCMKQQTTEANLFPTADTIHPSSRMSDTLMASDAFLDCAVSWLGTKTATFNTSRQQPRSSANTPVPEFQFPVNQHTSAIMLKRRRGMRRPKYL